MCVSDGINVSTGIQSGRPSIRSWFAIHFPALPRSLSVANVSVSIGSVGDCYGNAMVEIFRETLETELIDQ